MRAIMWFRSDLRSRDNPALFEACRRCDRGVLAVFVITPDPWKQHDDAPAKIEFRRRALEQLSTELAERNIALKILRARTFAEVPGALVRLARQHECDALHFNREYEVNERHRDDAVVDMFESQGVACVAHTDQCVFAPGDLRTKAGTVYTVFTPFKNAWKAAFDRDEHRPLPLPKRPEAMVSEPDPVPDRIAEFDAPDSICDRWPASEKRAHHLLRSFVKNRLADYEQERNLPAVDGTSTLSPYLSAGLVSIRQCLHAALDANDGRLDGGSSGAVQWIDELIWREFYRHIVVGFPRVSMHLAFKRQTERIRWNDDDEYFAAWCQGRTGVPIIDAGMRQLAQTGWMHNRVRMIVAMFLSKNLFLDWRRGERFFMEHLIDGDLASNNGGWQWAASTGTDAAPYFRVFNPYAQSRKFDPEGAFIREFVPELAALADKGIHDPAADARRNAEYPPAIVDCARTRRSAIEAFRSI